MENKKPDKAVKNKFLMSFGYAFKGIKHAFLTQRNFRVHLLVATFVMLAGLLLNISTTEWLVILVVMAVVVSAELFNTAIEGLVDLISPEYNKKAGVIKDCAAAAVLCTAIAAVIVGILIFAPKLILILK